MGKSKKKLVKKVAAASNDDESDIKNETPEALGQYDGGKSECADWGERGHDAACWWSTSLAEASHMEREAMEMGSQTMSNMEVIVGAGQRGETCTIQTHLSSHTQ